MLNSFFSVIKKIIPARIFKTFQPVYHFSLAFLAALFYFFPSRRLTVIGVTGTDGKSSVVSMLHEVFLKSGYSVASCSSLRFKINENEEPNVLKMTMPGRFVIQRFLARARKAGIRFAVIEVTSEGIKQYRHRFIKFDCAVFTNLAPEHIESHGGFENYREAKARLFKALGSGGVAVLNRDDSSWEFFAKQIGAKINFYSTSSLVIDGCEFAVSDISCRDDIRFSLDGVVFSSPLFGAFNVSNLLAATSAANSFGVPFQKIAEALKTVHGIPGRLDVVQKEPFRVIVDYAHTPNALRRVYQTLCNLQSTTYLSSSSEGGAGNLQSRLVCVLGAAGGGRDRWKRPELGKIAAEFCDEIVLTNEDPYDEKPSQILSEIKSGIFNFQFPIFIIVDRREAIRKALQSASIGDTVIITGKGAERFIMGPGGTKIPWDDRRIVQDELNGLA